MRHSILFVLHSLDGQVVLESKTTDTKKTMDKAMKFEIYYDFCVSITRIKPHQVFQNDVYNFVYSHLVISVE